MRRRRRLHPWARRFTARWRAPRSRYAQLRVVWQPYGLPARARRWLATPSDAYIMAAEYAYQMGDEAYMRQCQAVDDRWPRIRSHRSSVNSLRVLAAAQARRAKEQATARG